MEKTLIYGPKWPLCVQKKVIGKAIRWFENVPERKL